jgi:hypothetical protein
MTTQVIEISKIAWPKATKDDRTRDKDFVKKLARSIESGGMYQPIMVRPNPDEPGRYLGVFGWHRAVAVSGVLKREMIEAMVAVDMDEEEAEIARVAENLFRNPLSKAQQARAIARWHDYYDRKRVEYEATREAAKLAPGRAKGSVEQKISPDQVQFGPNDEGAFPAVPAESIPDLVPKPAAKLAHKPPGEFAKHAAAIMGRSETTIKRSLSIGHAFTADQLEVFDRYSVKQVWQETIARMPQAERDAVVNLIASGTGAKEAIAGVDGTSEVTRIDGRRFEITRSAEGTVRPEDRMTGEEWVRFHCAEMIAVLADPTAFIAHAILYRGINNHLQAFKAGTKAALADARRKNLVGGYYSIVSQFVGMTHPKHWHRCWACMGRGTTPSPDDQDRRKCTRCQGNGFVVKIDWS